MSEQGSLLFNFGIPSKGICDDCGGAFAKAVKVYVASHRGHGEEARLCDGCIYQARLQNNDVLELASLRNNMKSRWHHYIRNVEEQ
jgi:hypothetical protein